MFNLSANGEKMKQIALVEALCRSSVGSMDGVQDQLRSAMQAAIDNGVVFDEDACIKGACLAVMIVNGPDGLVWEQIERELNNAAKVSAFLDASQMGLTVEFPLSEDEAAAPVIGVLRMWAVIKDERDKAVRRGGPRV